jgi:hypothetical protein
MIRSLIVLSRLLGFRKMDERDREGRPLDFKESESDVSARERVYRIEGMRSTATL